MKVILLKDVKNQGKKDDIIDVANGYAQNFLIKNNLAVLYTDKSSEILNKEIKIRQDEEKELIAGYEKIKAKLKNKQLKFKVKTGANDRVFGSISSKQIAAEINKLGFNIDKKCVILNGAIDSLGSHIVKIKLHKKVEFNVDIYLEK